MSTDLKTLVQEVYFDLCDVIAGNSYKSLSYDNRIDFMLVQRDKLFRIEKLIEEIKESK
jgi:hypothetical protein